MTHQSVLMACCLVLLGVGLHFGPEGVTENLRGIVIDSLRPGIQFTRSLMGPPASNGERNSAANDLTETARLTEALEVLEERNRALQIRLAQFNELKMPEREISVAMSGSKRLILPTLIDVAVLGDSVAEQWRAGKLLDQGSKNGLRENELVISARKPQKSLIDFGEDEDISPEDALLLGRCIIGKIEHVGRWTSTFQLVTDAHYRGRAQLIRENSEGLFAFEAQGILKGQGGSLCKLEGIPADKSVRVHDAVYTADRDGLQPTPLYYGRVVEASLRPEDREWTILVKPAPLPSHLTTVQVLRTAVNPERLAVKQ